VRKDETSDVQATVATLKTQVRAAAKEIETFACESSEDFKSFERQLMALVWKLGRAAITLFLARRHERCRIPERVERAGRRFRRAPAQGRRLNTLFGVVSYWRTYLREAGGRERDRHGLYPLDEELGLTHDRMSLNLLVLAVRLALKLPFAEARATLEMFVPCAPSTEVIEKTVLGLGRHTTAWFETAPLPADDGEALIVEIDGKGAPTATDSELQRRSVPRGKSTNCCRRHRGHAKRGQHGKKPRRKKGDKSKNARMATMVIMYTLRRGKDGLLHGPVNIWRYASFAPKQHAFAIAQREVLKRGFGPESGKRVQLVTDGDNDLAYYAKKFLPHALHTIDVMHVIEKLWSAGECLYQEATNACRKWVEARKDELYAGRADAIVAHLQRRLDATPKTGPGNKGKRFRLEKAIAYLEKRLECLRYDLLIKEGLVLGTGAVEGAIKNIIGKRCDHGGMRWIKERVEAVVQLRCIDANGDLDRFIDFVHKRLTNDACTRATMPRLQSNSPAPLPTFGVAP